MHALMCLWNVFSCVCVCVYKCGAMEWCDYLWSSWFYICVCVCMCVYVYVYVYICVFDCTSSQSWHLGSLVVICKLLIWDLVPWPGIKPRFLALGASSLSHWTIREVPRLYISTHVLGLLILLAGQKQFQVWCKPIKDQPHLRSSLFPSNCPLP